MTAAFGVWAEAIDPLLQGLASMLRNLASQAPVIAVLDDVHFADASSWEARGSAIVGLSGSDGGRRGCKWQARDCDAARSSVPRRRPA